LLFPCCQIFAPLRGAHRRARPMLIDRLVTLAFVIRASKEFSIGTDLLNLTGHIGEQSGEHLRVTHIIGPGGCRQDLLRLLISAHVQLAPGSSFTPSMLADLPFAFAVDFDPCRGDHQMARLLQLRHRQSHLQPPAPSRARRKRILCRMLCSTLSITLRNTQRQLVLQREFSHLGFLLFRFSNLRVRLR
jgi:hypothetical protein